ncbi:MAG: flagellar basal body L-ring protein FlgH [Spirochaetia bacterium]|nr:flagellar basal body L-ring protein FlgH [Spirochaetia bacterium]
MKKIIPILLFVLLTANEYSQVSLYDGRNPYVNNYNDGDIVIINVNNNFSITINGEWNRKIEVNLKLEPDKKNLDFLKESQQSRNSQRQNKERQNVVEKYKFNISAIINKQAGGLYKINADKTINIDGKITRVICTGLINEKSIINGTVKSDEIAGLNLTVISQPLPAKDETYNGNDTKEQDTKNELKEDAESNFSKEQIRKYVVEYMKEILGVLK